MKTKKILLNLYECAEQLQVTPKWLKAAAIKDDIPCLKIGKRNMRFDFQAVEKALVQLAATPSKKQPIVTDLQRAL